MNLAAVPHCGTAATGIDLRRTQMAKNGLVENY